MGGKTNHNILIRSGRDAGGYIRGDSRDDVGYINNGIKIVAESRKNITQERWDKIFAKENQEKG